MAKMVKKAQEGTELRKGQYKRVGRISEKNPERAQRVADRMNTRASRVERGKEIANPSIMTQNPMYDLDRRMEKGDIRMKLKDKETMKMGGKLKPVDKTKKPGLAKLPTAVRNKMGFKKNGGTMSKKK
jgi:hypothetical protein